MFNLLIAGKTALLLI